MPYAAPAQVSARLVVRRLDVVEQLILGAAPVDVVVLLRCRGRRSRCCRPRRSSTRARARSRELRPSSRCRRVPRDFVISLPRDRPPGRHGVASCSRGTPSASSTRNPLAAACVTVATWSCVDSARCTHPLENTRASALAPARNVFVRIVRSPTRAVLARQILVRVGAFVNSTFVAS